jgi:hypothetical protein
MSAIPFDLKQGVRVAQLEEGEMTEVLYVATANKVSRPWTISLHPIGDGSKGLVEYSTSPLRDCQDGDGRWIPWGDGEVSVATTSITEGRVTAIRARCTVGELVVEIL